MRVRAGDPPAPTLALVSAVALHDALGGKAAQLSIKWPNDIMAGQAKLAGILLERAGDAVVIGFGANLAHHPQDLGRPATDMATLTGTVFPAASAAERLAESFAAWLGRWRAEGLSPIRDAWLAAAHPLGTPLATAQGEGRFAGLDESGALRLERPGGEVSLVHVGDVFLL